MAQHGHASAAHPAPAGGSTATPARVRERAHPTPLRYTAVALILAAITILEVSVIYIDALQPVWVPVLIVLSATKFSLVAMFYMHLRFDSRLFSFFFVGGLLLAAAVISALIVLFGGVLQRGGA